MNDERMTARMSSKALDELDAARATIARLEAERDEAREKAEFKDEMRESWRTNALRIQGERDGARAELALMGASAARMRLALEGAGCDVYAGAIGEAPICQVHDIELDGRCVIQTALADPAPLEWLRQRDAGLIAPWKRALDMYRADEIDLHDIVGMLEDAERQTPDLEWLRQHDAEVVEPYRAFVRGWLGRPEDQKHGVSVAQAEALLAGRAGTEGQP